MHKRHRARVPGILQLFIKKQGSGIVLWGSGNVKGGQGETQG